MTTFATRLENGTDTAVRMRMADALPLLSPGGVGGRTGVRNDGGGSVTVTEGTMSVVVSPFTGWIDGGTSDAQGGYTVVNDAEQILSISPGDATLGRQDVVVAVVNDDTFDGSGLTDCSLTVIEGAPGGAFPALPVNCLPLHSLYIPPGLSSGTGGLSSSNLDADLRDYIPTGVTRVASVQEIEAVPNLQDGTVFWHTGTSEFVVVQNGERLWFSPNNDEGWTNITLASGYTNPNPAKNCQYRLRDGVVWLRGNVGRASGGTFASGSTYTIATLPTWARPERDALWALGTSHASIGGRWYVQASGNIVLQFSGSGADYGNIDASYPRA